jgi:hypothetical protein
MTPQPEMDFRGETFDKSRDGARLSKQLDAVRTFMLLNENWTTLEEISLAVGAPQASVSARLRDLRTVRCGSHIVERRYVSKGLHEYRLVGKVV